MVFIAKKQVLSVGSNKIMVCSVSVRIFCPKWPEAQRIEMEHNGVKGTEL